MTAEAAEDHKDFDAAVDWLLNRQYPEEQERFWARAEGLVDDDEVDDLDYEEILARRAAHKERTGAPRLDD